MPVEQGRGDQCSLSLQLLVSGSVTRSFNRDPCLAALDLSKIHGLGLKNDHKQHFQRVYPVEISAKMTVKRVDQRRNEADEPPGNNNCASSNWCNGDTRKIFPILNRRCITSPCNQPQNYQNGGVSRSRIYLGNSSGVKRKKGIDPAGQDPESFHCAISRILVVAQCFGLLPVSGVTGSSPRRLSFRRRSLRTIYATVLALIMTVVAVSAVIHMVRCIDSQEFEIKGGIGAATAGAVFYGNSVLASVIFLRLAPRWAPLQHEWRALEQIIDRWGRPRLRRKFSIITAVVLLSALTEHILSMIKNVPSFRWQLSSENRSVANFLYEYSHNSHDFIISVWDYNTAIGAFLFFISKMATFAWNFTDLFVMLVATGLAESFKTLNKRMTAPNSATPTIGEWRILRENYAALSSLVKRVDNDISPIVLLSFANNLYFICLQLLNGLSPDGDGILNSLYFFGSFIFLVARTIGVTLLAARINDQSRIALPMLYTCPAKNYCIETQRLEHQLATDEIALSGLRFFSITRNFMLAVAGAIVTYEVVLLQFNLSMNQTSEK